MLRLAHQILSQAPFVPPSVDGIAEPYYLQQYRDIQTLLGSSVCPTIIADNVAQYYADTPKQDWTLSGKNFPCIAPPFEGAWFIEWKQPGYLMGPNGREESTTKGLVLVGAVLRNTPIDVARKSIFGTLRFPQGQIEACLSESKWLLTCQFVSMFKGRVALLPFNLLIFVTERGEYLHSGFTAPLLNPKTTNIQEYVDSLSCLPHIPLLTTGFLHCKNVSRCDATATEGPAPAWCKRMRLPSVAYSTICIDPNIGATPRPRERKTEGDRAGKVLHICRGHFMHCINDGENKGLFGRGIYGTFWVPSHSRGCADFGRTLPTYRVLAPTG